MFFDVFCRLFEGWKFWFWNVLLEGNYYFEVDNGGIMWLRFVNRSWC